MAGDKLLITRKVMEPHNDADCGKRNRVYIYCGSEQYMYEMELQNEQWLKDGRVIQDCIFGNILMPACKCRVSDV